MKPLNEMTLKEKLENGHKVWCLAADNPALSMLMVGLDKDGCAVDVAGSSFVFGAVEMTPDDLIIPPPRWEDRVSPENPVTCFVSNTEENPAFGDPVEVISNVNESAPRSYIGVDQDWFYATPAKKGELPILGETPLDTP